MSNELEIVKNWLESFTEEEQRDALVRYEPKLRQLREEDRQREVKERELNEQREKIRLKGFNEGIAFGERALLLRLLRARFGNLPAATITRIEAADVTLVECWGERVLSAQTLADVFDDPK